MSSIGVVVFRNAPLARTQVLQESMNNSLNISNNDSDKNYRQEIIIVRKKQKLQSPATIPVTSLVRAAESVNNSVAAKRPRVRDDVLEEAAKSPTPMAVARRNARERNRVRQVNDGFAALRRHIPEEVASAFENANSNRGPNKKLSKVETLRMAVEYIRNLETLLNITVDKENSSRPSIESFPSPASSSPRDNSQERSYYSMHSPTLEDDDMDDDDLDGSMCHLAQQHQYLSLPSSEQFQLVSTPHLYEEDEGQPLTPCSDLLAQEEANPHILDENFQFPNSAEQFTVIPEQSYCSESEIPVIESDFEVKYAESLHPQNYTSELSYEVVNPDIILAQDQYKFKEEDDNYMENQQFNDGELKRELPEIQVTPEDREQFEETLKWWQEKTRQGRPLQKNAKN